MGEAGGKNRILLIQEGEKTKEEPSAGTIKLKKERA